MTTRTLVLLRHAKSAHPAGVPDLDRPLTDRGHADAAAAGAWLASRQFAPDLVMCSPARRARETWHGVAVALGSGSTGGRHAPTVVYEPRVYESTAPDLLDLIRATGSGVATLLLVGHNPTLSMLSGLLDPDGGPDDGLRTCGLALHTLDSPWREYGRRRAPITVAHTARA